MAENMSMTAKQDKAVSETPMNAVVIYRKCDAARKATALLKRASDRADEGMPCSVKPWRVDLLNWPQLAGEALRDAAEAHLLLFALGTDREPTSHLMNWLEAWAARRQVADAALAVFDVDGGDTLSAMAPKALSEFAGRHGLGLILGDIAPQEDDSPKSWVDPHKREKTETPMTSRLLEQANSGEPWR
jgi:hypothetical protein